MTDFIADTINHTLTHTKTGAVFALPAYENDQDLAQIIFKAMEDIDNGRALKKTDTGS